MPFINWNINVYTEQEDYNTCVFCFLQIVFSFGEFYKFLLFTIFPLQYQQMHKQKQNFVLDV